MNTRGITTDHAPDWRARADCRKAGMDPELWFPRGTTGPHVLQADEAKAFCRECPVAMTCALWAINNRTDDGIYGGLSEAQRRGIIRKGPLTNDQITSLVQAAWQRDTRDRLVDTYLARTTQGDNGHVWCCGTKTSVTVAGRVFTLAQLAFHVGHGRAPQGIVKATCGRPYCVAAEHLADGAMRWQRDHAKATA